MWPSLKIFRLLLSSKNFKPLFFKNSYQNLNLPSSLKQIQSPSTAPLKSTLNSLYPLNHFKMKNWSRRSLTINDCCATYSIVCKVDVVNPIFLSFLFASLLLILDGFYRNFYQKSWIYINFCGHCWYFADIASHRKINSTTFVDQIKCLKDVVHFKNNFLEGKLFEN